MADPKYAGLPGIAVGQPDTFETCSDHELDLGEDETDSEQSETLHLSSLSWLGAELEVVGSKDQETLFQKFTRLRCEVNELTDDLNSMTESARDGNLAGLHQQVVQLQDQLEVCFLQEDDPTAACVPSQQQLLINLKSVLEDFSRLDGKKVEASPAAAYDLYLKTSDPVTAECLANLDRRLAKQEKLVGPDQQPQHKVLSMGTDSLPLVAAVDMLELSKGVLHADHLSHVEGRLAALATKLNALSAMKKTTDMARHNNEIAALFTRRELRAGIGSVLAQVLQRLVDLRQLHQTATGWNSRVSQINSDQEKTERLLLENRTQIESTQRLLTRGLQDTTLKLERLQNSLVALPV